MSDGTKRTIENSEADEVCTEESNSVYTSTDPEGDWQNFEDAMRRIVTVPKDQVDKVLRAERKRHKAQKEQKT